MKLSDIETLNRSEEEEYRNRGLSPIASSFLIKMIVGFENINYTDEFPLRRYFLIGGGVAEEYIQHEVKRLDPDLPSFRRLGLEITGMVFEWPQVVIQKEE